jgi:hypothetical protein
MDSLGMSRPKLVGVCCSEKTEMESAAILVAIFVAIFLPITLILSGERWRAAQDRARARRIADARMNARLLRLNI